MEHWEYVRRCFSPIYRVKMVESPQTPNGPMLTRMFKVPNYFKAACELQKLYPNGIYLMKHHQEAPLPGNIGTVFFIRYREIS